MRSSWLMAADGTGARRIDDGPGTVADIGFAWSNDGSRMAIHRVYPEGTPDRLAIVRLDGRGSVDVPCPPMAPASGCMIDVWSWSPDDRLLLGALSSELGDPTRPVTIDPSTGVVTMAPWDFPGIGDWQRLEP